MLDEKIQSDLIGKGRAFTHGYLENDPYGEDFESDQDFADQTPHSPTSPSPYPCHRH